MFQTHKPYQMLHFGTKFKVIDKELMKMCTFLSIDIKKLNFPIEFVQKEPLPPEPLPPPPSVWLAESDIALLPFKLS